MKSVECPVVARMNPIEDYGATIFEDEDSGLFGIKFDDGLILAEPQFSYISDQVNYQMMVRAITKDGDHGAIEIYHPDWDDAND